MSDDPFNYSRKLELMFLIARDARLPQSAIAVATVLIDHANKTTGACFPSLATIVRASKVPKTTAIRGLHKLLECGWITADKRTGAVNNYQLQTGATTGTSPECGTGATSNLKRGQTGATTGTEAVPPPEPEQKKKRKANRETGSRLNFSQWAQTFDQGSSLIPDDHHALRYARTAGIPEDLVELAWQAFEARYDADAKAKYADWPAHFRKALEGNWYRLWWIDGDGNYQLTTVGIQAQRFHQAEAAA